MQVIQINTFKIFYKGKIMLQIILSAANVLLTSALIVIVLKDKK